MTEPAPPQVVMTGLTSLGQVRQALADMIAEASDGALTAADVLAGGHTLTALGLSSLARIRLIDAIEDTFAIDLDLEDDLSSFEYVDALADHLATLLTTS
jgi:acyl carrier protein